MRPSQDVASASDSLVGLQVAAVILCLKPGDHSTADSLQSSLQIRSVQSPTVRKFLRKPGFRSNDQTGPKCASYYGKRRLRI